MQKVTYGIALRSDPELRRHSQHLQGALRASGITMAHSRLPADIDLCSGINLGNHTIDDLWTLIMGKVTEDRLLPTSARICSPARSGDGHSIYLPVLGKAHDVFNQLNAWINFHGLLGEQRRPYEPRVGLFEGVDPGRADAALSLIAGRAYEAVVHSSTIVLFEDNGSMCRGIRERSFATQHA